MAEIGSMPAVPRFSVTRMSTGMQASYSRTDSPGARPLRQQNWIRMLPFLVIGLIALVVIGAVFDTVFDRIIGHKLDKYRSELAKLQHVQMVLSDTEVGILDYAISGRLARLEQFLSDKNVVATEIKPFLPQLDKLTSLRSGTNGASVPASQVFADLQADWEKLVRLGSGLQPTQADIAPLVATTLGLSDRLKSDIGQYVDQLTTVTAQTEALSNWENRLLANINIGCAIFSIIAMIYAFRRILNALDSGLCSQATGRPAIFDD